MGKTKVAVLVTLVVACALEATAAVASTNTSSSISLRTTTVGKVIVAANGRTLYLFGKDRNGKSACTGQCAAFWPPLITKGKPAVRAGAKASLIGTTRRADGRLQVTYKHHPLYTFAKDTKKGQTNGEGITAFGGQWHAVSPAGGIVQKPASNGGGGGYGP